MENPLDEDNSAKIAGINPKLNKSEDKQLRASPITPRVETVNLEDKFVSKTKATPVPDLDDKKDALSEISFFYEEGDESLQSDDDKKSEATKKAPFILIQGAHCVGKAPHQCEDAYFISDRAFGVADGVSGWNDYGFSSDQFSLQLMSNSKISIEKCIRRAKLGKSLGKKHKSSKSSGGMKKSRSFLSMDNLDVEDQKDDDESSLDNVDEISNSSAEHSAKSVEPAKDKGESDDSAMKRAKAMKTDRTAGQKKESPLLPPEDAGGKKDLASKASKPLTLEEEIHKKLNAIKINQGYINDWEWGKENAATGGTA